MKDYFFEMCTARGELASSRVALENLVNAIEKSPELPVTSQILLDVAVKLAKEQIVANEKVLEEGVA
jgi:hypothetical protein